VPALRVRKSEFSEVPEEWPKTSVAQ
jgi:hypothetical protein